MAALSGPISERHTVEILGGIFRERRTGVLHLRKPAPVAVEAAAGEGSEPRGELETWSFVSGDLYLPPEHRLVATFRAQRDPDASESGFSWIELAVAMFERWHGGEWEFVSGAGEISADLYGPLPTAAVVMHAQVKGQNEFELARILGGDDRHLIKGATEVEGLGTELDPHEAFFLSRLDQPVMVRDLLRLAELDRAVALAKLCRLLSVDMIRPHEEKVGKKDDGRLLSPKLLDNFSQRIAQSLEENPVQAEPEAHRAKVAGLLSRLGGVTFYELLGIGVGAGPDEIHQAYTRLARVVHPSHAGPLGLGGKEAGLQLLFERATEAYLTLSDAERSRRYLQEVGSEAVPVKHQTGTERQEELDTLAERHYRQARAYEARGDYHFAIELLQQAVRVSPRAEYLALLASCQVRNPQWVGKGIATFQRAIDLESENPDLHIQLGQALEEQQLVGQARAQYERALEILPGHPEATAGLARLTGAKEAKKGSADEAMSAALAGDPDEAPRRKKGFLARLFGR